MDVLMYDWTRQFTIRQFIIQKMSMKIKHIALCILLAFVSCQRDEEMEISWVKISNEVIEPRYNTVCISSMVASNATIDGVTVILSTLPNFSTTTRYAMEKQNDGNYSIKIANLSHGTTYYINYRATNRWSSLNNDTISTFQTLNTKTVALVTSTQASAIYSHSTTVGGNVTDDGGAEVTERGVVYSTSQNPTTEDSKVSSGSGLGNFTCNLTDLQEEMTYYVRAYAINEKGTAYGGEISFTTIKGYFENGHEYVDLGLNVKWATMNVGASSPEDYGDYFAWGETTPKIISSYYNWLEYKYCSGTYNSLTKYNNSSRYGIVDNKTILEMSDDAAHANWGGSWRMPTDDEWTALRLQCTWTMTTLNGIEGYNVTSNSNGNSIFLPSVSRSIYYDGCYWSSSLNNDDPSTGWCVRLHGNGQVLRENYGRYDGLTVRPVCPQWTSVKV